MERISEMLRTPEWWISVVIAGIAVNLLGAYVKIPMDRMFSRVSLRWARRSAKRAAERRARIDAMTRDPMLRAEAAYWEMRFRIDYVGLMAVGFGVANLAGLVSGYLTTLAQALLFGSCLVLSLGMHARMRASGLGHEVTESLLAREPTRNKETGGVARDVVK